MKSSAATVQSYLAGLPEDRRAALEAVRRVILKNLDKDFDEGMQYGMIGYYVPSRIYPAGYHCDPKQPLPFACLASQKNYMSLYLGCVYGSQADAKRFQTEWTKTGKKLDMGKSCIRFRKLEDLALEVIAEVIRCATVKKFIEYYESAIKDSRKKPTAKTKTPRPASKTKRSKK